MLLLVATAAAARGPPQGVSEREIVLGMTGALSGRGKEITRTWKTGWSLAFASVNAAGGVHGRMLTLVTAHDGNAPAASRLAARELVEKRGIFAMVGSVGSERTEAYARYLVGRKMLLFCPLTGADSLRRDPPDRYVFNCRSSEAEEVAIAVRHLVEVRGVKPSQIALLVSSDSAGESGYRGFAYEMRRYRRDPSTNVRAVYDPSSEDMEASVRLIRAHAKRLRAVVTTGSYRAIARFLEKTRDLGLTVTATSRVGAETLADELAKLGPRYLEDVVVTEPGPSPGSGAGTVLRYRALLEKYAPGARPDFLSLQGYLSALILVEGLKRAGRDLDTERLVDALETIQNADLGLGAPITFGPSEHQGWHKIWGMQLQPDRSWKQVELE
jgi:branched-chain amino acid transport system substrate-binding protein